MGILVGIALIGFIIWVFSNTSSEDAWGCIGTFVGFLLVIALITVGRNWWISSGLVDSVKLVDVSSGSLASPIDSKQARSTRSMNLVGRIENTDAEESLSSVLVEIDLDYCKVGEAGQLVDCQPSDRTIKRKFYASLAPGAAKELSESITVTEVPDGKAVSARKVGVVRACTKDNGNYCDT